MGASPDRARIGMGKERVFTWKNDTATVTWDEDLCIHVGECTRAKGSLFEMGRKPWCELDGVDDAHVRDVVSRCPTGALAARFVDDPSADDAGPGVASDAEPTDEAGAAAATAGNTITVADGGPLYVAGELDIAGAPDRAPGLAHRAALCRCGLSSNKPFCDNSHVGAEFADHGAVGDTGTPLAETGGPLAIEVKKDGPLRVSGNLTIRAGSGRAAWQGTATALCRCGLSGNKPFCDGTHRKAGWSDGG